MKYLNKFKCFNSFCDTLVGSKQLSAPKNQWFCSKCRDLNKPRIPRCSCGELCDLAEREIQLRNRKIKTPDRAENMVFEVSDDWKYTMYFEIIPQTVTFGDEKLHKTPNYEVKVENKELEIIVTIMNEKDIYFQMIGHKKKLPKKYDETCFLIDFLKNRVFVHENEKFSVSSWQVGATGAVPSFMEEFNNTERIYTTKKRKNDSEIKVKKVKKFKGKPLSDFENIIKVCYDIETTYSEGGELIPYCIAFYIQFNSKKIKKVFTNISPFGCQGGAHLHNPPFKRNYATIFTTNDCFGTCDPQARIFYNGFIWFWETVLYEMKNNNIKTCIIFGFNNFKFDDEFCMPFFLNSLHGVLYDMDGISKSCYEVGYFHSSRFGKISSKYISIKPIKEVVTLRKKNHNPINFITEPLQIEFMDAVNYVPNVSLHQACKDYEIEMAKMQVNSVKLADIIFKLKCVPEEINLKDDPIYKEIMEKPGKTDFLVWLQFKDYQTKTKNVIFFKKLIEDYCMRDVESTAELYDKITNTLIEIIAKYTKNIFHPYSFISLSHISKYIFDQMTECEYATNFTVMQSELIDKTMFAGRCDYGILGEYESFLSLQYYDVTSEYPLAMTAPYPVGHCRGMTNEDTKIMQKIIDNIYLKRSFQLKNYLIDNEIPYFSELEKIFFTKANIYPPDSKYLICWAPLPIRLDMDGYLAREGQPITRLGYFNTAQKNRAVNSVQIKVLLYGGWKVELINTEEAIIWDTVQNSLNQFIETLGKDKTEARETNKSLAKVLKLMMNAIPGKFGQKSKHLIRKTRRKYVCMPLSRCPEYQDEERGMYDFCPNLFDCQIEDMYNSQKIEQSPNSAHYLASLIWSYANFILWGACFDLHIGQLGKNSLEDKAGTIMYCDTDSIVFDKNRVDPNYEFYEHEEIGFWDNERQKFKIHWKNKFANFDQIIVLGKKSYMCLRDGVPMIKHFKGIPDKGVDLIDIENIKEGIKKLVEGEVYSYLLEFRYLSRSPIETFSPSINRTIKETVQKKTLRFPDKNLYNFVKKLSNSCIATSSFQNEPKQRSISVGADRSESRRHSTERKSTNNQGIRTFMSFRYDQHWENIYLQETDGRPKI